MSDGSKDNTTTLLIVGALALAAAGAFHYLTGPEELEPYSVVTPKTEKPAEKQVEKPKRRKERPITRKAKSSMRDRRRQKKTKQQDQQDNKPFDLVDM